MNSNQVHRLLGDIGGVTSRKLKINMLANNSDAMLLKILKYAYDPNLKFNVKKIVNPVPNYKGSKTFDEKFFVVLDNLARRNISGNDAKQLIGILYARLSYESRDLFSRILNKDLRCGISVATINEALPNLISKFQVMLAKQYDMNHLVFPCYVQPKLDGIRAVYKDGSFFTRTGKVLRGLDHLKFDCAVTLDGELYNPTLPFEELSGLVRNHQKAPQIYYYVLDTIINDMKYSDRLDIDKDMTLTCNAVKVIPVKTLTAWAEKDLQLYFKLFTEDRGYEGVIVKDIDHPYQYKRSWDWMKIKKRETVDVVCFDIEVGQGKFSEVMGKLVCKYKDQTIRVGSGFSDAQREVYTLAPPIGKTIEVYYQELTAA